MQAIYTFATGMLNTLRNEVVAPVENTMNVIGDFILRHMQNILVVNDAVDRRTNMPMMPTMEPRGDLVIRFEPDTGKMYVSNKVFKADCSKNQVHYRDMIKKLEAKGVITGFENKRLSKGMKINAPVIYAMVIDTNNSDFNGLGLSLAPDAN